MPPTARVRIAYFVPPSRHFAGIERVVHEIATGLATTHGDRLDVHVVYASRYDEPLLVEPAYTAHVLDVDRLRHMALALRRTVRANDIDVLVTPQVEASVIAWLATRGPRSPVVVPHLHGNPRVEERDGTRRTRLAFAAFRHVVARRVPGVLAVSPALRDHAAGAVARRTAVHFAPNPVRNVAAPVAVSSGRTAETGRERPFRLLCVGRLSHQKGQDVLLRALAIARPRLDSVSLTLVGSGPEEAALRALAAELEISDIVDFAGYATDPAERYRAADCAVLASRWEGFGVVLVEALQFGLPLLATDCDFGPADVVVDERIGDLVPPEDPGALAEGIVRAAKRGDDREDAAFRRAAATAYGRDVAVSAQVSALRGATAGARGARARRLAPLAAG